MKFGQFAMFSNPDSVHSTTVKQSSCQKPHSGHQLLFFDNSEGQCPFQVKVDEDEAHS